MRVRAGRPAGGPAAAVGGPRPGRLHPPDGGGRPAVRAVSAAAHDRRSARAGAQPRGRPPVRDRLRQRRPAAAGRPPALRSGRQPRADRAGHAAAQAPGGRARPTAGTARHGRVRRHPGTAGRRCRGGAAAPHFRAARPVGGIHLKPGGTRSRGPHRNPHPAAHRGSQRGHAPGDDRRPLAAPGPHLVAVRGEADLQAGREGRLPAGRTQPARPARQPAARTRVPRRHRHRAAGGPARA